MAGRIDKNVESNFNEVELIHHRLEIMLETENFIYDVEVVGVGKDYDAVYTISCTDRFGDYSRARLLHLLIGFSYSMRNYKIQCIWNDANKHVIKIVKRWN